MGVVQYSTKTQTSFWFSLRLSSPSQLSIDAYNLPFYISGFVGTICEIKCFLRVTSIVFPPATAKIYIRTYLYFYILAKCKACTQKLFQTLLLHPSMYSIVQNTLNMCLTWNIPKFCEFIQKNMKIYSLRKMSSLFLIHYFLFVVVLFLFLNDFCALVYCNFAFVRVQLIEVKNASSVYTTEQDLRSKLYLSFSLPMHSSANFLQMPSRHQCRSCMNTNFR